MKKIKIIEATIELGLGGTEYVIQLYSKYLNKENFDVLVVGFKAGGERVPLIEEQGVPVKILNGDLQQLADLLQDTDVFHWHGAGIIDFPLLNVIRNNKPKLVIQTNIFGLYYHSPIYEVIDYDLYVSKMILIRRMLQDRYMNDNFAYKRKTLYNPVDVEYLNSRTPSIDKVLQFKKKHRLEDCFIIGRIGRADDNKFDPITLNGFAEFASLVPEAMFLLVGATPKMLAQAATLNIADKLIIFENTPDLEQLLIYYGAIDIFLAASSMGESFGMVIAEAMSTSTPVVTICTPDRDNAQIELVDNGKTGLVVERDPAKIASALLYLYKHKQTREKFGAAARAKVIKEYNARQVVGSLENLIYSHLNLPLQNHEGTLLMDFSIDLFLEYSRRCSDLWKTEH